MLDDLLDEISKLQEAKELLIRVFTDCGGYGEPISKETLRDLNKYFGWDDSE